jgi:hypothetical protein
MIISYLSASRFWGLPMDREAIDLALAQWVAPGPARNGMNAVFYDVIRRDVQARYDLPHDCLLQDQLRWPALRSGLLLTLRTGPARWTRRRNFSEEAEGAFLDDG